MHATILAAGFQTRLNKSRPTPMLAAEKPKALLPLGGGVALIDFLVNWLALDAVGCIHVVHNAIHAHQFMQWHKSLQWRPTRRRRDPPYIRLRNTRVERLIDRRGSVGDLAWNLGEVGYTKKYGHIIVFGDNVFVDPTVEELVGDGDVTTITARHKGTLARHSGSCLGCIDVVKNELGETGTGDYRVAGPIYLAPQDTLKVREYARLCQLAEVPCDDFVPFLGWLKKESPIRVKVAPGAFFDIGTETDLRLALKMFARGPVN